MDRLPAELWLRILGLLDVPNLANALQVCRRWNNLASDDLLWSKLFQSRWGGNAMDTFSPVQGPVSSSPSSSSSSSSSKSWKDVYEVQDRRDRIGLGSKITREGDEYYLVCHGEIRRRLGSTGKGGGDGKEEEEEDDHRHGVSDKIIFFIGDLEKACADAKRIRM